MAMKPRKMLEVSAGYERPKLSVVMPVFNQAGSATENIRSLVSSLSVPFELLILDDASEDQSLPRILEAVTMLPKSFPLMMSAQVYSSRWSLFETKSDNFLFSKAIGEFGLEIQADMRIEDPGFDQRLISLLEETDLFALSGRGVHRFNDVGLVPSTYVENQILKSRPNRAQVRSMQNREGYKEVCSCAQVSQGRPLDTRDRKLFGIFPCVHDFRSHGRAGRLGELIEEVDIPWGDYLGQVWIGETIMRGPLLFRMDDFTRLGRFDDRRFYLGNDDHDLCLRANSGGLRVGFSPVIFSSPLDQGSTRRKRSAKSLVALRIHQFRVAINRTLRR